MAFTEPCAFSSIALHRLRLTAHLGCGQDERQALQWVFFDLKLKFLSLPQGCISDELSGTVCYDQLSQAIQQVCASTQFHLLENLGWKVFAAVKEILPPQTQLWIRVTKEKPPIPQLQDGASFAIGDWSEV